MSQPIQTVLNKPKIFELLKFDPSADRQSVLKNLKRYLASIDALLTQDFKDGINVRNLVQLRSLYIDKMLIALWSHLELDSSESHQNIALVAVGGYGRGELHPHSDIDLLVLYHQEISLKTRASLEQLIALLWDCHLKVGQAVRTIEQCVELAVEDVTIATNLMESRLLTGNPEIIEKIRQLTAPDQIWSPPEFYRAKTLEQKKRYRKFDSSSFDLEPNLKSSPGGLRDIQLLSWIAQRTYYPKTLFQLIKQNIITSKEYYAMMKCQLFLWRVRFALHLVSEKPEDRLLFDYQKRTAKLMGFKDTKSSLAVEKMMKRYYRSVLIIRNINDILLQISEQRIFEESEQISVKPIDDYFQVVNQRVDAIDSSCFTKMPSLILKVFHHVAKDNTIVGITAQTLRAIRAARYKINSSFRNNKKNKQLFIGFWQIRHTSSRAMFLMKRSGVLADYLIPFQKITGQMQYDMFHNYTVDEHTLFLLKNLTEFAAEQTQHEYPTCSEIMINLDNPELIFLAGLFHDIGKGRGGDHSEIGANEARRFCQQHKLPARHCEIVEWLVANHLLMSLIAQKRDISDPKVIKNFAGLVRDQLQLDLLYILTVADIRATSHSLWNSWKDSLLKNLYFQTRQFLAQNDSEAEQNWVEQTWKTNKAKAKKSLLSKNFNLDDIDNLWQNLDQSYFAKRTPGAISWQTAKVLGNKKNRDTLIGIKTTSRKSVSEIFVYTRDKEYLFATLTATLNQQGLNIQAAHIYTDKTGFCFDSFFVLDQQGKALTDPFAKKTLKKAITSNLENISKVNLVVQRRMPRQFKYFSIPTRVEFHNDEFTGYTRMELSTRDQPGLLSAVAKAFKSTGTKLHDARITTLGEKVEDTFIISHRDHSPITEPAKQKSIEKEIQRFIRKLASTQEK